MFAGNKPENAPELPAPLDTPFTLEELKRYNGSDDTLPIYVAIKGDIFDVSGSRSSYGPGGKL
ncbi:Bifunctional protein GlmU [Entomophthora muscae]|uniref:Bifunctional protein GlmU n=1 Tax=Entomophthora muscae TaxID=34485 RepID=A0ACC2SAS8_9FUNG|nr:Bifunctional protein GlmU [Entomophthora muscae]